MLVRSIAVTVKRIEFDSLSKTQYVVSKGIRMQYLCNNEKLKTVYIRNRFYIKKYIYLIT